MNRKQVIIVVVAVSAGILLFFAAIAGAILLVGVSGGSPGSRQVGLIRVEGVIHSGRSSGGIFGGGDAGAEQLVNLLEKFRDDSSVKSLVIRINSPGGSAAGSQEVYQEIVRARRQGKKIVVSMGDVAASGGYYIASGADRIYADPASLTGSIGVIMETADFHELFGKLGINLGSVKSGKHKDMGTPSRPMTSDERKIMQGLINDVFDQFVTDVSNGRKLPKDYVLKLADGRVYTGRQALKLKLVDKMGSLRDALDAAAQDAGIRGKYKVVEYQKNPGLMDVLFGSADARSRVALLRNGWVRDLAWNLLDAGSGMERLAGPHQESAL
jgi:protease IV